MKVPLPFLNLKVCVDLRFSLVRAPSGSGAGV